MSEKKITPEQQHEIRYYVQQFFIPEMIECVKDGYFPLIALFPSAQWYIHLRKRYDLEDLKAAKVWEDFEKIDADDDHTIILYTFPQPEEVPESLYGAVLLTHSTSLCQGGSFRSVRYSIHPLRLARQLFHSRSCP